MPASQRLLAQVGWLKVALARVANRERERRAAMAWGRAFPEIERARDGVGQATPEQRPRLVGTASSDASLSRCRRGQRGCWHG